MAVLNIRNLPEAVHQALRQRAARNGRSMEAEAREILGEVCRLEAPVTCRGLQSFVEQAYQHQLPGNVVESFLGERRSDWGEE